MISEVNSNDMVLNPALLKIGEAYDKYCIITKAVNKFDINGNIYIQLFVKGLDGKQIAGRLFGEFADKYKDSINTFINKIAIIGFHVSEVYGSKSLDVTYVDIPDQNIIKYFKADLFKAVIPNVDFYIKRMKEIVDETRCVYTSIQKNLMSQSMFTELIYKSDPYICNGYDGYEFFIMYTVWERLLHYKRLGLVDSTIIGNIILAHTISDCIICKYDSNAFDYTYKVFNQVYNVCNTINFGTETDRILLKEILTTYINLRFGVESTTESKYGRLLFNEYSQVYNNLKYFNHFEDTTNSITVINGKFVR